MYLSSRLAQAEENEAEKFERTTSCSIDAYKRWTQGLYHMCQAFECKGMYCFTYCWQ